MEQPRNEVSQVNPPIPENKRKFLNLREKVQSAFSRQKEEKVPTKEDLPPMHIDFYFSHHKTSKDGSIGEEKISDHDIFLIEALGWSQDNMNFLRNVARGSVNPDTHKGLGSHNRALANDIYKTNTAIGVWDVPEGSMGHKEWEKATESLDRHSSELSRAFRDGNFNAALKAQERMFGDMKLQKERDNYLLQNFPKIIQNILIAYPDLKDKPDLKVLIKMGSGHALIANTFRQAGYEAKTEYSPMPHYFSTNLSAVLRESLNKKVPKDLLARAVFENFLATYSGIRDIPAEEQQIVRFLNKATSSVSEKEIKTFIEASRNKNYNTIQAMLFHRLLLKGIVIPQDAHGLERVNGQSSR